jgi:tRNA U34 5-carboxymethylaminomethyl modifying GTPase MnmE/TrmE
MEILIYSPGTSTIDWDNSKVNDDGLYTELAFTSDKLAIEIAETIKQIMESVQTKQFEALGSEIKGACSYSIAPVWAH